MADLKRIRNLSPREIGEFGDFVRRENLPAKIFFENEEKRLNRTKLGLIADELNKQKAENIELQKDVEALPDVVGEMPDIIGLDEPGGAIMIDPGTEQAERDPAFVTGAQESELVKSAERAVRDRPGQDAMAIASKMAEDAIRKASGQAPEGEQEPSLAKKYAIDLYKEIGKYADRGISAASPFTGQPAGEQGISSDELIAGALVSSLPALIGNMWGARTGELAAEMGSKPAAITIANEFTARPERRRKTIAAEINKGMTDRLKMMELQLRALDLVRETEAAGLGSMELDDATKILVRRDSNERAYKKMLADITIKVRNGQIKRAGDLRKEFNDRPVVKTMDATRENKNAIMRITDPKRLEKSGGKVSPAEGLVLIFQFMKMNDPKSVVRESEFKTAEQARATMTEWKKSLETSDPPMKAPTFFVQFMQRWDGNSKLTKDQVTDFRNTTRLFWNANWEELQREEARFKRLGQELNIDPNLTMFGGDEKLRPDLTEEERMKQKALENADYTEKLRNAWGKRKKKGK
jgi:hypothetical protein